MRNIRVFKHHVPQIGTATYVDPMATVIGDVIIGEHCSLWPGVVIRGDVHSIRIGHQTNVQDGSVLHVTHGSDYDPGGYPLVVGSRVTLGHQVSLHGCTIEDEVLIGIGTIVLDGAVVQSRAIVAAGSLVPPGKILESGYLWKGNPVQKARPLKEKELIFLAYSAQHYVRLKDSYLEHGLPT